MTTITKVPASIISDALWEVRNFAGWESASIYVTNDYSGRCMFGEQCFGFVFDSQDVEDRFFDAISDADHELYKTLRPARKYDSMGRGSIVYFPGFQIDEWDEEEED